MKKIENIYYFTLVFIVLLSSCNLDEKIYDSPMADTYIQSQSDVPFLMNGLYAMLSDYGYYKNSMTWLTIYSIGDEGLSTSTSYLSWMNRTFSTGSYQLYQNVYFLLINNVNTLIEVLGQLEEGKLSESYKSRILGELHFLRAFTYFNMVRLFGEVQINTEATTGDSDFYRKRDSVEDVYKLIFDDFKIAAENCLPFSAQPSEEFGRATKGSAQAMLSLAYLTYGNYCDLYKKSQNSAQYYQFAENYADSVILSNQYALIDNYADLWNVDKEKNAYKEVVFGVQFTRNASTAGNYSKGSEMAYYLQPNTRNNITGHTANRVGAGTIKIQPWFYDVCSTGDYVNDYRTEVSFLTSWENTLTGKKYITYPRIRTAANETVEQAPYIDKYKDPKGLDNRTHENDFFVIRMAEVYLIKAEAENELNGPTAEAYDAFNKLRERARKANGTTRTTPANLAPGLSKEDFRMKVFDERGLELVGEGIRWFDSVRMRYKDNIRPMIRYRFEEFIPALTMAMPTYDTKTNKWSNGRINPANVVAFSEKFLLWPICTNELGINPDVTQNPGW